VGFEVDKVPLGQMLQFLPLIIPPTAPIPSHPSFGVGSVIFVELPSGINLTPPQENKKIRNLVG
jgi:hypothetical protein